METITDMLRTYAPEYLLKFGDSMPFEHKKVIDAIINCRTGHYGTNYYGCLDCSKIHEVFRSCGNRHCPSCQHHKTEQWLEKQVKKELPGHHFLITFTETIKL